MIGNATSNWGMFWFHYMYILQSPWGKAIVAVIAIVIAVIVAVVAV